MPEKKLSRSIRKFLRRRKAEIRRQFLFPAEAEAKIRELVQEIHQQYHKDKARSALKISV